MKQKNYSIELKDKVALSTLQGHQTANEIASAFGVPASLVNLWKKQAHKSLPSVFGGAQPQKEKEVEEQQDDLYQQSGKLHFE
jgi:transposase